MKLRELCNAYTSGALALIWRDLKGVTLPEIKLPPVVAYLYHDAESAESADPILHSCMVAFAKNRRTEYRNETPLCTQASAVQAISSALDTAAEKARQTPKLLDYSNGVSVQDYIASEILKLKDQFK